MGQQWRVTVWGVRGSAPRPEAGYLEYGGNTVCTSLEYQDELVILDGGTGLSCLGQTLSKGRKFRRLHILLSHLHLDHVMGLFLFSPFYDPEAEICLYGDGEIFEKLETLITPPFWPVGFDGFRAKLRFHQLCIGNSFSVSDLTVSTMGGNHPGGSLLYRLDGHGKRLTYGLDCETDEAIFPALASFARDSSLLIWDAGFAPGDLRTGWGHSTWEQGIALGRAAGAKQVLMTHYGWEYSDEFLRRQEAQARQRDAVCTFGREGMVIVL